VLASHLVTILENDALKSGETVLGAHRIIASQSDTQVTPSASPLSSGSGACLAVSV